MKMSFTELSMYLADAPRLIRRPSQKEEITIDEIKQAFS